MRIVFIILFLVFGVSLFGQYRIVQGGSSIKIQDDDIPTSPVQPVLSYTIFKRMDFGTSAVRNDVNTESNVQTMLDSPDMVISGAGASDVDDSILIIANGNQGTIDTVQSIWLDAVSGDHGAQEFGQMFLNGVDGSDDTLTAGNWQFWIYYPAYFPNSAGHKLSGIGGYNRAGVSSPGIPSGGIWGPTCITDDPYWEAGRGWSTRFTKEVDNGLYTYIHNMWFPASCGISGADGQHYSSGLDPQLGVWHKMNIRVIMNTVSSPGTGVEDGVLELYRNDTLIAQKDDCVFRRYDDVYFDYIFHAVLTGSDAGRTEDTYVQFDDFLLWREILPADWRESRTVGDVIESPN